MAKRKELRQMQDTLDQRESEKIQEAAKAAKAEETLKAAKAAKEESEADSIRDSLMEEMKIRAQAEDYSRLQKENESLMDRVLDLEKRLRLAEKVVADAKEKEEAEELEEEVITDEASEEVDYGETEDNLPEDIREDDFDDTEDAEPEDSEEDSEDKEPPKVVTPKTGTSHGKGDKKASKAKEGPVMVHTPKSKRTEVKPDRKSSTEKGQAPKAVPTPIPAPVSPAMTSVGGRSDGPGNAYKYWSWADKCWKITPNIWVADQFGGDFWKTVPVWYKDGQIHHLLSEAECEEYLPR